MYLSLNSLQELNFNLQVLKLLFQSNARGGGCVNILYAHG